VYEVIVRATPSQIAIRLICGEGVPHSTWPKSRVERLRQGRDMLVRITKKDFGFDLQAWHEHLKVSREGGYTYNRNVALPRIMQKALESPEWREAVESLAR
jgi:hypothetical protein